MLILQWSFTSALSLLNCKALASSKEISVNANIREQLLLVNNEEEIDQIKKI